MNKLLSVTPFVLAAQLSACSPIPLNPDAGVDAGTNEAGLPMSDAGVPQINAQTERVLAAANEILKDGEATLESNYASYDVEKPLIDEAFRVGTEEYNSSVNIFGFSPTGDTQAGVRVRTYNNDASTIVYDSMVAKIAVEPKGVNKIDITVSSYECEVPPPSDKLTFTFDEQRKTCRDLESTTIKLVVAHDTSDSGVPDAGVATLPHEVTGCSYQYRTQSVINRGGLPNDSITTDLPPGDPYCKEAALGVIEATQTMLGTYDVCKPINDNLSLHDCRQ